MKVCSIPNQLSLERTWRDTDFRCEDNVGSDDDLG